MNQMKDFFYKQLNRTGVRQLVKFSIVGGFNAILDWTLFYLFKIPLKGQVGKQVAKALSFIISGSSSYYFNRKWTFRSSDQRIARQFSAFLLVAVVGFGINNFVFFVSTSPTMLNLRDIVGLFFATAIAAFWNFFANKYWTFK